ncbi:hypothetical protein M0D21_20035 [Aquimarina sp. D1M17]|uniref:hypothetical protein n=1 Tax=Aquimarina acroporae TaxID=2937283 RepID=UPI0020C0509F|nr:hypothetical protein [Aquimarina acroporae]MCK8523877.1 hypothetical protein [Aquimarina acroporae]
MKGFKTALPNVFVIIYKTVFLCSIFLAQSCHKSIDIENEKQKIQALIDLTEQAHYKKDAELFFRPNAEQWYDVRKGNVQIVNKANKIKGTQSYLEAMDFDEMIKRSDPIIEISDDGTMASYIGSITVKGVLGEQPVYWLVSWQNVLKKINDQWKIISTANTEADEITTTLHILDQVKIHLGFVDAAIPSSIYALAHCEGPEKWFKTLILSQKNDGRMEQLYDQKHIILKHGKNSSWSKDLITNEVNKNLSPEVTLFTRAHELHWLSIAPETRYKNPRFIGFTQFKNQNAFHIQFKNSIDQPVNFYYSFDSFLPLGFDITINDSGEKVTTLFENWQKQGAFFVFHKASFIQAQDTYNYDFVDIKINATSVQDMNNKNAMIKQL